ncbi:MAG: M50 family metallopeptidase [Armatimonadota bacterium]
MPLQFESPRTSVRSSSVHQSGAPGPKARTRRRADLSMAGAAVATVALSFVPWAGTVTWPLRLMVTYLHEGFHALAALVNGGSVLGIEIVPTGSGVTRTMGGIGMLVSSAGYLGAMLHGTLMLAALRRGVPGRTLLVATAAGVGLVAVAGIASPFTIAVGAAIAVALALLGAKLPRRGADWLAGFVGVQCLLNAFFDLRTLFYLSVSSATATDAMNMQAATFVPAVVWAVLWIATGAFTVWRMLVRPILDGR